jgi:hypothetical protein
MFGKVGKHKTHTHMEEWMDACTQQKQNSETTRCYISYKKETKGLNFWIHQSVANLF